MVIARIFIMAVFFATAKPSFGEAPTAITSCQIARRLQLAQRDSIHFIDVRSSREFDQEHISGASNVPLTELAKRALPRKGTVLIYCGDDSCALSKQAAETLITLGYGNVRLLSGGLAAWKQFGYPVEPEPPGQRIGSATTEDIKRIADPSAKKIIDVRPRNEFLAGHLPGAASIPLETLTETALSPGKDYVVYDRLPERSHKAALLLAGRGCKVTELVGGVAAWAAKGYPLEVGREQR